MSLNSSRGRETSVPQIRVCTRAQVQLMKNGNVVASVWENNREDGEDSATQVRRETSSLMWNKSIKVCSVIQCDNNGNNDKGHCFLPVFTAFRLSWWKWRGVTRCIWSWRLGGSFATICSTTSSAVTLCTPTSMSNTPAGEPAQLFWRSHIISLHPRLQWSGLTNFIIQKK